MMFHLTSDSEISDYESSLVCSWFIVNQEQLVILMMMILFMLMLHRRSFSQSVL